MKIPARNTQILQNSSYKKQFKFYIRVLHTENAGWAVHWRVSYLDHSWFYPLFVQTLQLLLFSGSLSETQRGQTQKGLTQPGKDWLSSSWNIWSRSICTYKYCLYLWKFSTSSLPQSWALFPCFKYLSNSILAFGNGSFQGNWKSSNPCWLKVHSHSLSCLINLPFAICVPFPGFGWHLLTLLGSYVWNNWILSTFLNRAITVLKQLSLVYLVINGIISLDFPSDMLGWLVLITVGVGLVILLSYWFISFKLGFNNPLGRC